MYNARIVTNDGKSFGFGYHYGSVFDITPLTGSDVTISTSQGFQQIGVTVEHQAVGGMSRTIKGVFIDSRKTAVMRSMLETLPVFTTGRLYFNEMFYTDFTLKKTPVVAKAKDGRVTFSMLLYCADPFWHSMERASYNIGDYTAVFQFPVLYDQHVFAVKNPSAFVNCYNKGSVKVPFRLTLRAESTVQNPSIINANTLEYLRINRDITLGDVVEIYRENGRLKVMLTSGGIKTDIFSALDEGSDLFWIYTGDNILRLDADDNLQSLVGVVAFDPAYMGVLDEA